MVWRCISCPCCFPSPHCLSHDTPHLTDLSGVFKAPWQRLAASHRVASAPHEEACGCPAGKVPVANLSVLCLSFSSIFSKPSNLLNTGDKTQEGRGNVPSGVVPRFAFGADFIYANPRPRPPPSPFLSRARCTRGSLVCVAVVGRNVIILARQGL